MSLNAWARYWKDLDWVEELFNLAMLGMEACMVHPWQLLLGSFVQMEPFPFWGVCALLWGPYVLAGLLARVKLPADRKQALVAGLMLLSVLVAVRLHTYGDVPAWDVSWIAPFVDSLFTPAELPPTLLLVGLTFIGWWRGMATQRQSYETQQVWSHFRIGVVLLFWYFVVTLLGQRRDMALLVFAYFFFGLMSISLARILELGGIHDSTLGSKQWVAVLAGSTLGSLALALLASLLVSRQALRALLDGLRPLWRLVGMVAWFVASAVLYLAWPLLELLMEAFQRILEEQGSLFDLSMLTSPLASPLPGSEKPALANVLPYCRTVVIVLFVFGGLLLITRMIRTLSERRSEREDEERESLWSGQDLAGDLKKGLQQRWAEIKAFAGQFGTRRRSAASIRKIYASMVDLAAESGHPRRAAETPYEYLETLYRAFPGGQEAADTITEAYVRVHYGEVPDSRAEMARIAACWQEIQALATETKEASSP